MSKQIGKTNIFAVQSKWNYLKPFEKSIFMGSKRCINSKRIGFSYFLGRKIRENVCRRFVCREYRLDRKSNFESLLKIGGIERYRVSYTLQKSNGVEIVTIKYSSFVAASSFCFNTVHYSQLHFLLCAN